LPTESKKRNLDKSSMIATGLLLAIDALAIGEYFFDYVGDGRGPMDGHGVLGISLITLTVALIWRIESILNEKTDKAD
jgi:hypothetical protein